MAVRKTGLCTWATSDLSIAAVDVWYTSARLRQASGKSSLRQTKYLVDAIPPVVHDLLDALATGKSKQVRMLYPLSW